MDQNFAILSVFTSVYTLIWGQVLGRANLWYAFTPTDLGKGGKFVDLRDLIRWPLSLIFLIILPVLYLFILYSYYFVNKNIQSINPWDLHALDILKLVQLCLFLPPLLGFYNIWQCIVRLAPKTLYHEYAIAKIRDLYPNAFLRNGGIPKTALLGLGWILLPICSRILFSRLGYF
jgi:hypothetical protein